MPRLAPAALVAALTLLTLTPAAQAFTQPDQSLPYSGTASAFVRPQTPVVGQSFVAGTSGHLTHVRLWLTRFSGSTPVAVQLRTFDGTAPGATLWSTTVTDTTTAPLRLPVAVPVTAGTAYALVVDGGTMPTGAQWRVGMFYLDPANPSTDRYPAGTALDPSGGP